MMSFLWESNRVKELRHLAHKGTSDKVEQRKIDEQKRREAEKARI